MHESKALRAAVLVRACSLSMYAGFLWTTAHLCYSISRLIGIPSFLNHHLHWRARSLPCLLPGCRAKQHSSIQVFLIFAIKLLSQRSWKYLCGNKHLWRHNKSGCSKRWGNIWEVLKRCASLVTQGEILVPKKVLCQFALKMYLCLYGRHFYFLNGWSKVMSLIMCTLCCISLFLF